MNEEETRRRKQVIYRANHRGIREMDIILGTYASANVMTMDEADLGEFERIMAETDRDLLTWFTGEVPMPNHIASPLFDTILKFTTEKYRA